MYFLYKSIYLIRALKPDVNEQQVLVNKQPNYVKFWQVG